MKIYTKTGDCGTTGLFAGPRVEKDHPRIQAYGAVDELNAVLGMTIVSLGEFSSRLDRLLPPTLSDKPDEKEIADHVRVTPTETDSQALLSMLKMVQSDLFSIGAELATPEPEEHGMCLLTEGSIREIERWIDRVDDQLPPLKNFVLPGGCQASAMLHLARTVCRRAERDVVALSHQSGVHDCSLILIYLNRLSDFLFVLARQVNRLAGVGDTAWERPKTP